MRQIEPDVTACEGEGADATARLAFADASTYEETARVTLRMGCATEITDADLRALHQLDVVGLRWWVGQRGFGSGSRPGARPIAWSRTVAGAESRPGTLTESIASATGRCHCV